MFLQHPGRVLSRNFLSQAAHFDRTIDVQIGRLPRKLRDDAEKPHLIKSVRGAGCVLVPAVEPR